MTPQRLKPVSLVKADFVKPTQAPSKKELLGREHDDDIEAYLVELGQRVRSVRAVRGMSRKVLAQESGVSERYIAQLESGLGNVSIMLLRRVALATGVALEDLVASDAGQSADWPLIRELLRKASPGVTAEVKNLLSGRVNGSLAAKVAKPSVDRVALIGLRGAGKSTLGKLAAEKLGWRFVELNREIERAAGFSISEIFSLYGQDGYRRYEQAALDQTLAINGPVILATGGGIVSDPVTFERLLGQFFTVWVKASPAEHMRRVRAQGDLRPMGADKAASRLAMSELIGILSSRERFYARANAVVDTSGQALDDSVASLVSQVKSYCVTGCPWQSRNRA